MVRQEAWSLFPLPEPEGKEEEGRRRERQVFCVLQKSPGFKVPEPQTLWVNRLACVQVFRAYPGPSLAHVTP